MSSYTVTLHATGCKVITCPHGGGIPVADLAALLEGWTKARAKHATAEEMRTDPILVDGIVSHAMNAACVIGRLSQLDELRKLLGLPEREPYAPAQAPTSH